MTQLYENTDVDGAPTAKAEPVAAKALEEAAAYCDLHRASTSNYAGVCADVIRNNLIPKYAAPAPQQAAPLTDAPIALSPSQIFDIAAPYFVWNAESWHKATEGKIGMPMLLEFTKAAINASKSAGSAASAGDARDAAPDGWIAVASIRGEQTSVAFRDEETARACCVDGEPLPFWMGGKSA